MVWPDGGIAVVVMTIERPTEEEEILEVDAVNHLKHHGICAVVHRLRAAAARAVPG